VRVVSKLLSMKSVLLQTWLDLENSSTAIPYVVHEERSCDDRYLLV
jgi:hypothetical protein